MKVILIYCVLLPFRVNNPGYLIQIVFNRLHSTKSGYESGRKRYATGSSLDCNIYHSQLSPNRLEMNLIKYVPLNALYWYKLYQTKAIFITKLYLKI